MELLVAGVRMTHNGYFLREPERGVHALTSTVTEDENLFLLAHMGLAEVNPENWRLRVEGMVSNPALLNLAGLLAMRQYDVMSVHECAGSPLTPAVPKRRVGNVVWSGVRLVDVLDKCGLAPEAAFVWTHGLETGDFADLKNEPYVKDLPLSKATSPEVLLAIAMNGNKLRAVYDALLHRSVTSRASARLENRAREHPGFASAAGSTTSRKTGIDPRMGVG